MSVRMRTLSVAIIACVIPLTACVARAQSYHQNYAFGTQGGAPGQMGSINAVAALCGPVYVGDVTNSRVDVFTPYGSYWASWFGPGSGDAQLTDGPADLALSPASSGDLYIVDRGNCRIQRVHDSIFSWTYVGAWGSYGSGDGQFLSPTNIAVDANGFVYVGDPVAHRIQKFTRDGVFVTQWGSAGSGDGQFLCNAGISVDWSGNIVVADECQGRIQVFSSSGAFLGAWGTPGAADGQLLGPTKACYSSAGNILVADKEGNRVEVFSPAHAYIGKLNSPGGFTGPVGVVEDSGQIWVADAGHGQIKGFFWIPNDALPVKPSTWGRLKAEYR